MHNSGQERRSSPQFQRIKSKIDDLEAKLSKNWELEGQLNQRCDELSKERESLIAHLRNAETKSRQFRNIDNTASMQKINEENQTLIKLNRELTAELKKLQKYSVNNTDNQTIQILKDSLDHEKDNNKKLVDELIKLKNDSKMSKLRAENTVQKRTIIKTMKKLEQSQMLYARSLDTIKDKEKQIRELQALLFRSNNEKGDNESSASLMKEVEELHEQVNFLTEENEILRQHQIEMINQHLQSTHENLESVKSDSRDFQNKLLALDSLKHENELLRHQLFSLSYQHGFNPQDMLDELTQIRDTCKKLQQRVEQYEKDENEIQADGEKSKEVAKLKENEQENTQLLEILQSHSTQLKENTETIELQRKAIEALKNEIKNLRSENIKLMNPDSEEPLPNDDFPDDFIDIDNDPEFWKDKCQYLKARIRKLEQEAYINSKVHRNSSGDSCTDFSEEDNKPENENPEKAENEKPKVDEEYDSVEDTEPTVQAEEEVKKPPEPKFISEGEIVDMSDIIDDDDDPNFIISSTEDEPLLNESSQEEEAAPKTLSRLSSFNFEFSEEEYLEREIAELQERVAHVTQLINKTDFKSNQQSIATSPAAGFKNRSDQSN